LKFQTLRKLYSGVDNDENVLKIICIVLAGAVLVVMSMYLFSTRNSDINTGTIQSANDAVGNARGSVNESIRSNQRSTESVIRVQSGISRSTERIGRATKGINSAEGNLATAKDSVDRCLELTRQCEYILSQGKRGNDSVGQEAQADGK